MSHFKLLLPYFNCLYSVFTPWTFYMFLTFYLFLCPESFSEGVGQLLNVINKTNKQTVSPAHSSNSPLSANSPLHFLNAHAGLKQELCHCSTKKSFFFFLNGHNSIHQPTQIWFETVFRTSRDLNVQPHGQRRQAISWKANSRPRQCNTEQIARSQISISNLPPLQKCQKNRNTREKWLRDAWRRFSGCLWTPDL